MSEIERIDDQLQRAFEGEAWHGPSVLEVLKGVTTEQAAAKPLAKAHSIWEIVLHLTATYQLVLRRIQGIAGPLAPEEDWPAVTEVSAAAWETAVADLQRKHVELRKALVQLTGEELDHPILEGFSSLYVTLHGLIQHNTYHAGQIAVLRKG